MPIHECPLCGKTVDKLFLTVVEGSRIEVCEDCGKYGNVLKEVKSEKSREPAKFTAMKTFPKLDEPEEEFNPDYGNLIIRTRQKKNLERKEFAMKINEKESVIRRVELQQMIPDENLRKKIEDFLEIELTQIYEKTKIREKPTRGTLTLGDIVELE
jgi:putative transcription factor